MAAAGAVAKALVLVRLCSGTRLEALEAVEVRCARHANASTVCLSVRLSLSYASDLF
jgi:hypothetical protein